MQTRHLFDISDLKDSQLDRLFSLAGSIKNCPNSLQQIQSQLKNKVISLIFFESSTRTRVSFEMAAHRLGVKPIFFQGDASTSISKGETILDTLLTIEAMGADAFVIRSSVRPDVKSFYEVAKVPCLNAGFGGIAHPTQALLDAFTLQESLGELKGKKLLFLGDIKHSRVARSNAKLLTRLGVELAVCAPEAMVAQESDWDTLDKFSELESALEWCDVVMALRTQFERHEQTFDVADFVKNFQLNSKTLARLSDKGFIMHPGPFVEGEEITREVLSDSRCLIHTQVENGVWVRAALLYLYLTGDWS